MKKRLSAKKIKDSCDICGKEFVLITHGDSGFTSCDFGFICQECKDAKEYARLKVKFS